MMLEGNDPSTLQSSAKAFKSSICWADFSARFNEMCFETTSNVNNIPGELFTYSLHVRWTVGDDDVCHLSLFVNVILI